MRILARRWTASADSDTSARTPIFCTSCGVNGPSISAENSGAVVIDADGSSKMSVRERSSPPRPRLGPYANAKPKMHRNKSVHGLDGPIHAEM